MAVMVRTTKHASCLLEGPREKPPVLAQAQARLCQNRSVPAIAVKFLLAVRAFQHALDANGVATLSAFKGPRIGQPHEAAASRAWHKLIRADGGDAYCLGFATGKQLGARLSQRWHGRMLP